MAEPTKFEESTALLRTGSTVPAEPPARPKVLRRPPQFSRNGTPVSLEDTLIEPAARPAAALTRQAGPTPWQEDSRFGLLMIAVVLVVNVVLGLAVPHMGRNSLRNDAPTVSIVSGTAMPAPTTQKGNRVTLYSDPAMLDESGQAMDLNNLSVDDNDFTVDSPAPAARALND